MKNEKYGVIYMIRNTINNKIYFGQTIQKDGFDSRYAGDLYKNTHNTHLKRSIEKYGIENFEISKEFDIAYSKEELDSIEEMYIKMYNTMDMKYGYNKTSGGATNKLCDESIEKISNSLKAYYQTNSPHNKGVPMSEEQKKKLSIAKMGINSGEDHPNAKKIICLNTGDVYPTILQASREVGLCDSSLSLCCKGKGASCGFSDELNERLAWAYYEDYLKMSEKEIRDKIKKANDTDEIRRKQSEAKKGKPSPKRKSVVCLNTGEVFTSAAEAGMSCGKSRKGICACCNNKTMSCGKDVATGKKLVWVHYEDYILMTEEEVVSKIQFANKKVVRGTTPTAKSRRIICLNTGEIFQTLGEIQRVYGANSGSVLRCCRGEAKTCGTHPVTQERLRWAYADEM